MNPPAAIDATAHRPHTYVITLKRRSTQAPSSPVEFNDNEYLFEAKSIGAFTLQETSLSDALSLFTVTNSKLDLTNKPNQDIVLHCPEKDILMRFDKITQRLVYILFNNLDITLNCLKLESEDSFKGYKDINTFQDLLSMNKDNIFNGTLQLELTHQKLHKIALLSSKPSNLHSTEQCISTAANGVTFSGISLGMSWQEMVSQWGVADATSYKQSSWVSHYFARGVDIIFSSQHTVCGLVLHTNPISQSNVHFGKYNKCVFNLRLLDTMDISSESTLSNVWSTQGNLSGNVDVEGPVKRVSIHTSNVYSLYFFFISDTEEMLALHICKNS